MTADAIAEENKVVGVDNAPVVEMRDITKTFGEVRALDKVSFLLASGEIRALVGENGAGKTTLMNILYGMYKQDSGSIRIYGEDVTEKWSPRAAIEKGIGMIHQHFSLVSNHTALENIVMPTLKWTNLRPEWKRWSQKVEKLASDYHFEVRLEERVENLSIGERQQIEILKALYQGTRILILDEPTAVLTPQQAERLMEFLVELRNRGYSVVLVTHKLNEAMAVCDNITVMRGGKHVGTVKKEATTPQEIARMMVERDWISPIKVFELPPNPPVVLETRELVVEDEEKRTNVVDHVSIRLHKGEVVGVAGVAGNGQIELAEALVGLRRPKSGAILLEGQSINKWSIGRRRQAGIGYIPEDRHAMGMIKEMSVAENLVIDSVSNTEYSRWGVLHKQVIRAKARQAVETFNIKTPTPEAPIGNLSGGNQQKTVLARVLMTNPKAIIACQPTRGLDFSATEYVRKKLVESARAGVPVLLISSDLDEILELSHRVVVMFRGRIVGEFKREEIDLDTLGLLMTGYKGKAAEAGEAIG
ncbi:ABC transporter ATP-binding protein [Moorellaceae bacterium AZ2]